MSNKAGADLPIVGNYQLVKKLGKGAYGTVKLGVHVKTGEKVAVKVIKSKHIKTLKERQMVEREKKILLNLNHPHVVKLKEVIERPNKRTTYMVFEYIPGGELFRHLVSNGPMSEPEARRMFRQLVSGLEYLHANLIVHRDIKPENILLDENGNAKISDFGLANIIRPGRRFETFCGSLHYAAPEILNGVPYIGPPIDVWALGIVLYCMVVGCQPWDAPDPRTMIYKIMNEVISFPATMSSECQDLIRKMLRVNEKERITLAQIRSHPWTLAGYGIPLSAMLPAVDPINELNDDIMRMMSLIGIPNTPRTRREILENKHSPLTHTYLNVMKQRARAKQNSSLNPSPRERPASVDELLHRSEDDARPDAVPSGGGGGRNTISSEQNDEVWKQPRASSFDNKKRPAKIRLPLPLASLPSKEETQVVNDESKDSRQNHRKHESPPFNPQGPLKSPRILDLVVPKKDKESRRARHRLSITHKGKKRLSEKAHHRENANLSEVPNFGALYEKNTPKQEVKHVNFAVTENDHSTQCRDSDSDGVKESKKENRIASFSRKKSNKKMKHSSEKNRKKTSPTTKEFKCATTSSASMTDLISKVTKVLKKEDIKSEQDGLIFKCGTPAVNFEIELVTLSKLPNMRGIKFKHVGGDESVYKEVVDDLISKLKL